MRKCSITKNQIINSSKCLFSKKLRKEMTGAEKLFWRQVRRSKIAGCRFRRQQIIDGFIVDFYCAKLRLVVEIDGDIHKEQKSYDRQRDEILKKRGLKILRFSNNEIFSEMQNVITKIKTFLP